MMRIRWYLKAILAMTILPAFIGGCAAGDAKVKATSLNSQAVTLARDFDSGTKPIHRAGEVIAIDRIRGGYIDKGPGCTDEAGTQLEHLHATDLAIGIGIDNQGTYIETPTEHDHCGYGLVTISGL